MFSEQAGFLLHKNLAWRVSQFEGGEGGRKTQPGGNVQAAWAEQLLEHLTEFRQKTLLQAAAP